MIILGVNSHTHDVSVAVISDETPLMLLEEERISRQKHHDGIVFNGTPPQKALKEVLTRYTPDLICHSTAINHAAKSTNWQQKVFLEFADILDNRFYNTKFFNHHLCHASSAFYCSGFDQAYILTLDSQGDGLSCSISIGHNSTIEKILEIPARTSLCAIYSFASELLGMGRRSEGSLTGLAAYGLRSDLLQGIFKWTGYSFVVNAEEVSKLENLAKQASEFQEKADIALSIQASFEQAVLQLLQSVCTDLSIRKITLAGGGVLNTALNQKIAECGRWDSVFITPAAGDSGTALGAALLALPNPQNFRFEHTFWGHSYTEVEVKKVLDKCNLETNKTSAEEVGELIAKGYVGAIFDGAMEFGPRALGHRSIVADPRRQEMGTRLNNIKKRQWWRPVAPCILHSEGEEWFSNYKYSPYMTQTFRVKDEKRGLIQAITHHDSTARLQSVKSDVGFLHDLLVAYKDITGIPILCNTSYNVQDPIVRTPEEAIATFYTTNLDFLYCQGWLLKKHKES